MINVVEYLEASARRFPDRIAAEDEHASCTYAELRERSRRVASALGARFAARTPVPLLMDKGVDTLALFLGAAEAGCFYVLLNPELPAVRLNQILAVLNAPAVVTGDPETAGQLADLLSDRPAQARPDILSASDLLNHPVDEPLLSALRDRWLDTNPLYVNFTSGSTGVPKGVAICHRSVIDFIDYFAPAFDITDRDVIGNQAPFDFDVSVKDIYSALRTGARLVIIPRRLFSAPAQLLDFVCDRKVTTLIWAVSALCLVSTFRGLEYRVPTGVRKVLFSGEAMPLKHLKAWQAALPSARFVNLYGPTEITCNCTYHEVDPARDYTGGLPIGRAFPNERVFLLDDEGREQTEPGAVGEICVAGTALALGYYNAPEQTADRFVQNPLNTCYPERIYRTGDLGRWNADGELYFCGRKDFQIKYQGHRIELEEIELAMAAVCGVERACCLFDEDRQRLTGCYVGTADAKSLRSALAGQLPHYMVPGKLIQLPEMPLTKNGKMDRKRLKERTEASK